MDSHRLLPEASRRELVPAGGGEALSTPARVYGLGEPVSDQRSPDVEGSYWQMARRHLGLLLAVALLSTGAALLVSRLQTPLYQAAVALEIQGLNDNFLRVGEVDPIARATDSASDAYLQTQVQVLRSRALVKRVVSRLKLEERPEYQRVSLLERGLARLGWAETSPVSPQERAVSAALDDLGVSIQRGSRIVRIQYQSEDPRLAAGFANLLAEEFIEQNLELRLLATRHTGEWLGRQLEDLKIKLRQSEDQLQGYARAAGLLFTADKNTVAAEKLRQLQEELSKVQAERMARQSRFELTLRSQPDSLPEVLDNGPLRDYQIQLTELQRQLAEQRSLLTPTHYKVKRIQAQATELEAALEKERANIVHRIRNEYDSARRREELLAAAHAAQWKLVSEQDARAVHYHILQREVETNRQLYEIMLQRVKEASLASAMRASNILVVDPAEIPSRPYRPNPLLNGVVGLLSGILLGLLLVVARERADHSLKQPGDAALYLRVPELGVIPSQQADSYKPETGLRRVLGLTSSDGEPDGAGDRVEVSSLRRRPSLVAESFRATLASILFAGENGSPPGVILLTSPNPREGKTTSVSNLGIALARVRPRVLLIDGDMRHPRLHEVFSLANELGLSDLLRQTSPLAAASLAPLVRETQVPGLYVLTSGSPSSAPSELLHSPRLHELLDCCRQEFAAVLIDAPPVLQLADARLLGRLADAVVLVCRAGETDRDSAASAAERLTADGTPLLGAILNDWDPHTNKYYKYGRYYRTAA